MVQDSIFQALINEFLKENKDVPTSLLKFEIMCRVSAKEANSQSQKPCKPGAAEYMKCMSRELFFVRIICS